MLNLKIDVCIWRAVSASYYQPLRALVLCDFTVIYKLRTLIEHPHITAY